MLKRCNQVLEPLTRAVPGLLEALYLMGKIKFLGGLSHAFNTLQFALSRQYLKLMFISFPLQDFFFFFCQNKNHICDVVMVSVFVSSSVDREFKP
jgi:hypothetical protein